MFKQRSGVPQYNAGNLCLKLFISISKYKYNKRTGDYLGFIDLGPNIPVEDEDEEAKEALVFMLISWQSRWKYLVSYVLINIVKA